ncbi:MAG: serine/threonine-protein kinase [Chthoniobacterales bacterium]
MRGVVSGTRLFQRFTLQKVLGRGGMGVVWLARDDRLDRLVALKLVPEEVCFDPSAQEELKRETRKSLLLTHPNIVRIFDFVEDEQGAAISMEYVDGSPLSALRVQKRAKCFAVSELAPWVTSLCDALAYAHDSARIIHRDLKPANLMVNSRMELKVADFGIACTLRDSMSYVSVRESSGTLYYMSPQQLLGEDPAATDDIYAVGATLYELLSGKPPFFGGAVAAQVREVTPPWVAERREKLGIAGEAVPKNWEEAIAACLSKNPADRPQSPVDLARRLGLGGTIRLTAATQESKMRALLQALVQARVVGAAAGVVALLAAGVIAYRSSRSASEIRQAANTPVPNAFAMEVRRPDSVPTPILAPSEPSIEPNETITAPAALAKNGALQLTTAPAGARFAIFSGVVAGQAAPGSPPIHAGIAPESVGDLPPGRYTLFFRSEGWPEERAEISLEAGETLPVDYTFAHGSVNITSNPDAAEIFLASQSLGRTPLAVDLPLGKQQLTARHPDRPEKTQSVAVEPDAVVTLAFDLRAATTSRSSSRRRRPKPPESAFEKFSRSFKKAFSNKPPPKKRKG